MAKDKKSFVAYCDWMEIFEALSDEEAGKLAKHLWRYVNDLNPETDDKLIKLSFISMQQTLKRDLKKYESLVDRNQKNGLKGGRPKKADKPTGLSGLKNKPRKADSVSVSVSVNDSVSETKEEDVFISINNHFVNLKGTKWMEGIAMNNKLSIDHIQNRLNEFTKLCIDRGDGIKSEKEYKSHFVNWFKQQKGYDKAGNQKSRSTVGKQHDYEGL